MSQERSLELEQQLTVKQGKFNDFTCKYNRIRLVIETDMAIHEADLRKYQLRIKELEDALMQRDEVHEIEIKVSLLSARCTVGKNPFSISIPELA